MNRRPMPSLGQQTLLAELEVWRSGGIVSAEQCGHILDLYETPAEIADRKRSLAIFALCSVAAVMVGLAALLLVSYNWQDMSAAVKLTILFGTLIGAHAAAFWLRLRKRWLMTSEIVFFLACVFYGTTIWLIAQIFNIQSHYPDGLWIWAIGVLPFALCLDTPLLHAVYAGLLATWAGAEVLGFPAFRPWFFLGGQVVPNGAYTLPLLVLPGLLWAYRKQSATTIAIFAPLLAWWAILQSIAWRWETASVFCVGMAGAMMLMIAAAHRVGNRLAVPYRVWGILLTGGVLVLLSHAEFIGELFYWHDAHNASFMGLALAAIGAAATAGSVLLPRCGATGATDGDAPTSIVSALQRQWMPIALMLLFVGLCFWVGAFQSQYPTGYHYAYSLQEAAKWSPQVLVPMLLVNASMVVLAVWLMHQGLRADRGLLFAVGVLYFLLWAVLRYVDLFAGVAGMLGAALMFLLCGVGLFAVARFWQRRKEAGHV